MVSSEKQNGGYFIPNWIVHTVVPGLILALLGSSGTALWASYSLVGAVEKVQSLPSPILLEMTMDRVEELPSADLAKERRQAQLAQNRRQNKRDQRQDERLSALEKAVFWRENTNAFFPHFEYYACGKPRSSYRIFAALGRFSSDGTMGLPASIRGSFGRNAGQVF